MSTKVLVLVSRPECVSVSVLRPEGQGCSWSRDLKGLDNNTVNAGADPELVSRRGGGGAHVERPSRPLHTPNSSPPSLLCPFPSVPSLPYPSPPSFPSLSLPLVPPFPFPALPWRGGSGGPPPENFEILDCCRWVLAHSGMQKGVCKCVFLGRAMKFFSPQSRGAIATVAPPPWIRRWLLEITDSEFDENLRVTITVIVTYMLRPTFGDLGV